MAVIKHNSIGRTDVSSRSGSIHYDNAKYGSVVSVSGSAAVMAQFFLQQVRQKVQKLLS